MKKILLLIFLSLNLLAQNRKGQNEIALPLHPLLAIIGSFYGDFEHFHSPRRSTTIRIGHQGDSFLISYFSNRHFQGNRLDLGQRWYLNGETAKAARFFAGINATFELSKLTIKNLCLENKPKYFCE